MSDDGIERLEEKLYSRTGKQEESKRPPLHPRFVDAPRGWQGSTVSQEVPNTDNFMKPIRHKSFFSVKNVFIASAGFFVIALGFAAYFIFGGGNVISTKNIDIAISGPVDIAAGETLPLQITITNKNATEIQLADLIIEFPDGTRTDTDLSVPLPRTRESLGTVLSGESVNRTVRAVLFGEQGAQQRIKVSVEYRIASSNAVFSSENEYMATISSSPMSLVAEGPTQIVSGQQQTYTITVRSNAKVPLKNVLVTAEYPFGFAVASVAPAAVGNGRTWALGDIPAGESRSIVLAGSFTGQDGEERVLRFASGQGEPATDTRLTVPFVTKDISVALSRPFVGASLSLAGESSEDIVASRGQLINVQIEWRNNLPVTVHGVQIELSLKGGVLDPASVKADSGFYRSSDSTIIWSSETAPQLTDVAPGASGTLSFSFLPYAPTKGGTYHSAAIDLAVTVLGKQEGSAIPETVTNVAKRRVLVSTDLALTALSTRSGPFSNQGPVPPKANQATTYGIVWTVKNTANAVANATVSAVLPSYVTWNGAVSPTTEKVIFDPNTRTVSWQLGNLNSSSVQRQVAFQVTLTPSVSQVGQAPAILGESKLSGADRFTGTVVTDTKPVVTTKTSDAGFQSGQENVVP